MKMEIYIVAVDTGVGHILIEVFDTREKAKAYIIESGISDFKILKWYVK